MLKSLRSSWALLRDFDGREGQQGRMIRSSQSFEEKDLLCTLDIRNTEARLAQR